ncbi:lysM domain protein [Mycobacterium xenopi 3993]|nr:lysM domain protein [Mycobacterium xenopi 3993]
MDVHGATSPASDRARHDGGPCLAGRIDHPVVGVIAHFGETVDGAKPGPLPARLAVVRVDAGETLPHLAARVAPDAPVGQVVQRIRELNDLRSATLTAGQTLIARSADAPRCSAKPARPNGRRWWWR